VSRARPQRRGGLCAGTAVIALAALVAAGGLSAAAAGTGLPADPARAAMLARDRALELPTPYVPPPGNALDHHAAGFAQIMCNAVFITGLDPEFAAENVGYFTAPHAERARLGKPLIDRAAQTVTVDVPDGTSRVARFFPDQGCVTYPAGSRRLGFVPHPHGPALPDPATQDWPMGDRLGDAPLPPGLDAARVQAAVDAAFATPEGMTAAFVVSWRGRIIAERYAPGITMHTPLESWSMGKSITASMMGVLIQRGAYHLWQPAPIPEWQSPQDPRAKIRIADLLRMSSGLRIRAPYDPDYDPAAGYADHLYLYTGGNAFHYAATRPLQWPPNTVGRYRNTDPVLVNYLIRLAVESRGEDYLAFPQRALFDPLGIRTAVIETDPEGDLLTQGYDLACARDWIRLGNLYLQDGVWLGRRILPPGFTRFVSTLAPAWVADGQPIYGGFFWINGDGALPVPKNAYSMLGAGGQYTVIVPSHDLVVVRLGHFKGSAAGSADFKRALGELVQAVPRAHPAGGPR
jgi:CubicO group peptidase (beta-lactamase class C family)